MTPKMEAKDLPKTIKIDHGTYSGSQCVPKRLRDIKERSQNIPRTPKLSSKTPKTSKKHLPKSLQDHKTYLRTPFLKHGVARAQHIRLRTKKEKGPVTNLTEKIQTARRFF